MIFTCLPICFLKRERAGEHAVRDVMKWGAYGKSWQWQNCDHIILSETILSTKTIKKEDSAVGRLPTQDFPHHGIKPKN